MLNKETYSYFSFTKKERRGILVLVSLILFFLLIPFTYSLFNKPKQYSHEEFEKEITQLQSAQKTDSFSKNNFERNIALYNEPIENKEVELPTELFYFNPNTLDAAGWKRLGIKDKTIATIQKYLSKGGKFYKPEDIGKIWGIAPDKAQQLIPYINIEPKQLSNYAQTFTYEKKEYKKEIVLVDINVADTTAFIALPGIGNKLANRIINFRNKLGGFYSVEQVGETFGLPDSTFQKIKPRLQLNITNLAQININTATVDEMKQHPYMRYAIANAVVQYRNQHGNYTSVADVKKVVLVTDEIYKKLSPYLKVD
ncbi:ComEA family DNA-binding protein [Ferruginibacter albus]|uniref:ComEA family DNA-binding protein n=1 Tax=Ferruginibacter albus TaxID=2875540 RepID=UPI001CC793B0|nr:helix-hairpin-helix domain-containing protein [Ferruginibacter albus]UAY52412.1 helix-hairpin-helix domain-containing protein [Ferruginibacter albus]